MPSIRQLAREQQISVITVQRAYDDLQREGLLIARPGKGFFVAATGEDQKLQLAQQRLIDAVAPLIAEARASGLTAEQIIDLVRRVFEEGE